MGDQHSWSQFPPGLRLGYVRSGAEVSRPYTDTVQPGAVTLSCALVALFFDLQVAQSMLDLAAGMPSSREEVIAFGTRLLQHANRAWYADPDRGLSYCTHRGCGQRCTGKDRAGCILNSWTVDTSLIGSVITLKYTLPNPLDPARPVRFLEVTINRGTRVCLMHYGTLDGRPCTISKQWLARAKDKVGVNFTLSDVPWYDYISPPQRPNPIDEDGSSLKDPAVIPRAQLGFSFFHLGAVLDFFLPEVGHAQQCRCVSSKEYFRPSASTGGGHVPVEEMPYIFYDVSENVKATFGAVVVPQAPPAGVQMEPGEHDDIHKSALWDLRPVYVPNNCVGLFPERTKVSMCDSCHQLADIAKNKHRRALQGMQVGGSVSVRGSSLLLPKGNSPEVCRAYFGPQAEVRKLCLQMLPLFQAPLSSTTHML